MPYGENNSIGELVGCQLTSITGMVAGSDQIIMVTADGARFELYHDQNCCESVRVEDVIGDVSDLLVGPVLVAEERTSEDNSPAYHDSFTWTFYEFRTNRGSVTVRWLGESNGYYSESVDLRVTDLAGRGIERVPQDPVDIAVEIIDDGIPPDES